MKRVCDWKDSCWRFYRPSGRHPATILLVVGFAFLHTFAASTEKKPSPGCALARPYITGAQAALTLGDPESALQKLDRAVQISPQCAEAHLRLALVQFQTGAIAASIEHYQHALKPQPRSYSARYNLALAFLRQHKLREARTQLEQAVRVDPHQPDAAYA